MSSISDYGLLAMVKDSTLLTPPPPFNKVTLDPLLAAGNLKLRVGKEDSRCKAPRKEA